MTILKMYPTSINVKYMEVAENALRDGKLIIYPTDTLYAIGCDAMNSRAIERICRIKDINPQKTNLSIICCDISQAAEYVRIATVVRLPPRCRRCSKVEKWWG